MISVARMLTSRRHRMLSQKAPRADMGEVISLKKYIDANPYELLESTLASFRSALDAMGNTGVRACPHVGAELRTSLSNLREHLSSEATPDAIRETEKQVETKLEQWGERAAGFQKDRAQEFKELTLILVKTAGVVGERDQRYVRQVQEFTARLQSIADLQDLKDVRDSLFKSAMELKACADQMARESKETLAQLQQEVGQYQTRLEDAEKLAGNDAVTGLDNRRKAESFMEFRIARNRVFSIIFLDLNGFKQINDTYGHLVGDEVLKQFASELKSAFRSTDVVSRWGGDEFVVILDCDIGEANAQIERLSQWVFGEYTIRSGGKTLKISVNAAVGVAAWKPGETSAGLLERVDQVMYKEKGRRSGGAKAGMANGAVAAGKAGA
jgi:diguanylate cyclase (GGDEF)-like protein